MKRISVYDRNSIQNMDVPTRPHIIISISSPTCSPAQIRTTRATLGRVNLFFWDLDRLPTNEDVVEHSGMSLIEANLFQISDAKKIIDLVEAHFEETEEIIVHCQAGISRSAGVAAALHLVLNDSDEPIFSNKRYKPNMRVYRMVLNEWYSRHPRE